MNPEPTVGKALSDASLMEVNGGELEPVQYIYKPEGVGIVLANALGLDADMSVARLRSDLAIAQRVHERLADAHAQSHASMGLTDYGFGRYDELIYVTTGRHHFHGSCDAKLFDPKDAA
jgi:hypothetical protein